MPPLINTTSRSAVNSSTARSGSTFNLGSSARDALSDLDYSDYLSDASPSVIEVLKKLVDQGLWKYSSTLLAQPFDVAKIVLQIQDAGSVTDKDIKPEEDHKHRNQEDVGHQCYLLRAFTDFGLRSTIPTKTRTMIPNHTLHLQHQLEARDRNGNINARGSIHPRAPNRGIRHHREGLRLQQHSRTHTPKL